MNMKCGILTGITLKILSTFIYGSEFGRKRKKMNNWNPDWNPELESRLDWCDQ